MSSAVDRVRRAWHPITPTKVNRDEWMWTRSAPRHKDSDQSMDDKAEDTDREAEARVREDRAAVSVVAAVDAEETETRPKDNGEEMRSKLNTQFRDSSRLVLPPACHSREVRLL